MTTRQQLVDSLRLLCEREGGLVQVAATTGFNPQTLWQITHGTRLPSGEARGVGARLQKALDRHYAGWHLLSQPLAASAAARVVEKDDEEFVAIQTVRLRANAGIEGFAIEIIDEPGLPIFFRSDWMQSRGYKPDSLYAIKVRGSSMEKTLYAGDVIVINTADREEKDDEVFVINCSGEVVVKRLMHRGGAWIMHSDNEDQNRYPPVPCDENCFIIGHVIYRQSDRI